MKRGDLASAVVTAISIPVLGFGLGLILNGAASARVISARSFSEGTVVLDCRGRPQVRRGVSPWDSTAAGPGRQRYTKITLLYPGAHPACAGASGSVMLDTS